MKLKTIAISCRNYGNIGGTENFAKAIVDQISSTHYAKIHLITQKPPTHDTANCIVHKIPKLPLPSLARRFFYSEVVQKIVKQVKPDIFHSFDLIPGANIISYGCAHAYWIDNFRKNAKFSTKLRDKTTLKLEQKTFSDLACKMVLPNSELSSITLSNCYPYLNNKLMVIEPGIDNKLLSVDLEDKGEDLRHQLGLSSKDFLILFVGNNFELKGLPVLIQIIACLARQDIHVHLLIIGRGNAERFKRLGYKLGILHRLHFLGPISSGLSKYFSASDMLALLSACETYGMVVLEAMAYSKPVFITDSMGISKTVSRTKCGLVLPQALEIDLATEKLRDMILNEDLRRDMAIRGRAEARSRIWEKVFAQLDEVYTAIFHGK